MLVTTASPRTAAIGSLVVVCLPPSQTLAVAKIWITSPSHAALPERPTCDLMNRRQQARPGDRTGVDGVAHVLVNRRAEAVNRRESGFDRGLEITGLI